MPELAPGSLPSRLAALGAALGLPPLRLSLETFPSKPWRSARHATLRELLRVDGEPRYSVKWYARDHPRPFAELAGTSAAFGRATGLRTPVFVARADLPAAVGLVEEWIPGARDLASALAAGAVEPSHAETLLTELHLAMQAAPALATDSLAEDRRRCLQALVWLGEGSADFAPLRDWLLGPYAPFSPVTRLLHEDLLPCNVLLTSPGRAVLVDFDHCLPSRMPWYAAWRLGWFSSSLPVPSVSAGGVLADQRVRLLCVALEVERQFSVLERTRFLHDWKSAWCRELLQGREAVPGAAAESRRLSLQLEHSP